MVSPYEPVKLVVCPRCRGAEVVEAQKGSRDSYEPVGLKRCPTCKGTGTVAQRQLARIAR